MQHVRGRNMCQPQHNELHNTLYTSKQQSRAAATYYYYQPLALLLLLLLLLRHSGSGSSSKLLCECARLCVVGACECVSSSAAAAAV
eukprot:13673-Heterococcus_DN1.PRE.1